MSRDDGAWSPEEYVAFWINQTSRALLRVQERRLRGVGLTMAHLPLFQALSTRGPLTQKELTAIAGVEQPSMAEMLARLDSEGLVRRKPGTTDKRVRLYELTAEAKRRFKKAQKVLTQGEDECLVGFSAAERASFRDFLRRAAANLTAAAESEG